MRSRFTRGKGGTDGACFREARIRARLQPLFVRTIAAHYFTVREGQAISNIVCLAHFGTVRPQTPLLYRGRKLEKPHREKVNLCNTRNCASPHTVLSLSYQGQWLPLPGFRVGANGKHLKSPLSIKRLEKREMSARQFTFCGIPDEPKGSRFVPPSRYPLTRKTIRSARAPNRRIEYDFLVFGSLITFHPPQKGLLCFWSNVNPGLGPTLAEELFSSLPQASGLREVCESKCIRSFRLSQRPLW